jgi:peroxiredoxin
LPWRDKLHAWRNGDTTIETLKTKLDLLCATNKENSVWNVAYEDAVAELHRNGFLQNVLGEGDHFPDFILPNAEGKLVSFASLLDRGPVIVSFFRGEWCPWCQLMLTALAESLPEIEAAGASLLALTPETAGYPLKMKELNNARFEVLSDVDCGVGLTAGIIFRVPKLYRARIEMAGINFAQRHGNDAWFLPAPATFIVDQDGRISWRFLDADFTHRAEPADIIQAVRSLSKRE